MLPPIFLVSTGRTGTRFFSGFFQEYAEGVASHHTSDFTRLVNVVGNMRYLGLAPMPLVRLLWRALKVPVIRAEKRRYLECNPYYYNILDLVWESFPEARVVHVIRHPRTFVQSHIKWERQRWMSRIANQLVPFWGPVGYHEQLLGLGGNTQQRIRYYAKVWRHKNEAILRAIEGDPRAITYRFEDLFATDGGPVRLVELLTWLGLTLTRQVGDDALARRRNETTSRPLAWDTACDDAIRLECAPLMEAFGYEC